MQGASPIWPELPYAQWKDTCATLHLWTQVVGKVRLAFTPWINHSWHATLYVTARGLTTSPIPMGARSFSIDFDLVDHELVIRDGDVQARIALRPMTVAAFYAEVMTGLKRLDIPVAIRELPCEIAGAIAFSKDHVHAAYDAQYANRFWRALVQVDRLFKQFRTGFQGKASPVHFFWGSFDLAVTRFSGRTAPLFAGTAPGVAQKVMQDAYSHEVSSAGFWPGGNGVDASFYSYAYPAPPGFAKAAVRPVGAVFNEALGEFVLPYEAVRTARDPDAALLDFLQSTYDAAADLGQWDRRALERAFGIPGVCPLPQT
jgi:Family of unknown function (DUF5996)